MKILFGFKKNKFRILLLLTFSTAWISCRHKINITYNHIIPLSDSGFIANLYCMLPSDFDTSYSWIDKSDCYCCDFKTYRLHSKKFDVVKESGFIKSERLTNGFYMTVRHSRGIACEQGPDTNEIGKNFIDKLRDSNPGSEIYGKIDTSQVIDGHRFYILKFFDSAPETGKWKTFDYINACTLRKGRWISIVFMNNVLPVDSFEQSAYAVIKSMEFR